MRTNNDEGGNTVLKKSESSKRTGILVIFKDASSKILYKSAEVEGQNCA